MLLGSKIHTAGDTKRWTVDYSRWLENPANIVSAAMTSSSLSCTITPPATVLGKEVIFFLSGGTVGEKLTVAITMTDSDTNIKKDTIAFTVVAP